MSNFQPSQAVTRVAAASKRPVMGPAVAGVVSLAMGEPDFDTPAHITDAAVAALRDGQTHYADQNGDPRLREALARQVSAIADAPYDPERILITHGATAGLAAAILAIVNPGDRVVIPEPSYSLYVDLVALAGGTPVLVPASADLHWDLAALRRAVAGARLVVFSNPCNPTGVVHTRDELDALAEMLTGTDTLVLADEAYDRIVFAPGVFASALTRDGLRDRVVYCQTLSKTYAMTGWRLGYLAGPGEVIAAAARIHRTVNGSINSAVQLAGLAAVTADDDSFTDMLGSYRDRRDILLSALSGIEGLRAYPPDGTFYVFVAYDLPKPAAVVAAELKRAGVAVRAGSEYGPSGEGHFRLSFAAGTEAIVEAAQRIGKYMADARGRRSVSGRSENRVPGEP